MKNQNTGNPYSFPQTEFNDTTHPDYNGMTLIDYFAAKAMQSLIEVHKIDSVRILDEKDKLLSRQISEASFCIANLMLEERSKRNAQ